MLVCLCVTYGCLYIDTYSYCIRHTAFCKAGSVYVYVRTYSTIPYTHIEPMRACAQHSLYFLLGTHTCMRAFKPTCIHTHIHTCTGQARQCICYVNQGVVASRSRLAPANKVYTLWFAIDNYICMCVT